MRLSGHHKIGGLRLCCLPNLNLRTEHRPSRFKSNPPADAREAQTPLRPPYLEAAKPYGWGQQKVQMPITLAG